MGNSLYIKKLIKEELVSWDQFVDISPQGSIFCKSYFLNAINVNFEIIAVIENEEIIAGQVLTKDIIGFYSNPLLAKYLGVCFGVYKGNKFTVENKKYKILNLIIKHLPKRTFDYYFHPNFKNWLVFFWNNFRQEVRYTYRLDLSRLDEASIWNNLNSGLRNEINSAIKNGIIIKEDVNIEVLYKLVNISFLRQGSKVPLTEQKVILLWDELEKNGAIDVYAAIDNAGREIACAAIIYDHNSAYLILNGIDNEHITKGANGYLIYNAIIKAKAKVKIFDFEGSMHKTIESFYRKFGGELTTYYRIWYPSILNTVKSITKKTYIKLKYNK